jgi:hypothetical protein
MESSRRVVCLEPRKVKHGVVLKLVTANRCGGNQDMVRSRCLTVIMGLALQWL